MSISREIDEIKCQHPEKQNGCHACGMYGYIICLVEMCSICKRKAWTRPDPYTIWEGKEFLTFDGLKIKIVKGKNVCGYCLEESGVEV